jgi:hypothetical protein
MLGLAFLMVWTVRFIWGATLGASNDIFIIDAPKMAPAVNEFSWTVLEGLYR